MRIRLLALILAAAVGITLAVTLTASAGNTPQDTVKRLLQPHGVADVCGSLTPALRGQSAATSCVRAFYRRSEVTHLVISHVLIRGKHATLEANFDMGNPVEEHFSLVRRHGVWLIAGSR